LLGQKRTDLGKARRKKGEHSVGSTRKGKTLSAKRRTGGRKHNAPGLEGDSNAMSTQKKPTAVNAHKENQGAERACGQRHRY